MNGYLALCWVPSIEKQPAEIVVERREGEESTCEIWVDGIAYPFRYDVTFAYKKKKTAGFVCECLALPQIKGRGEKPKDAIRACQVEFARLFEETSERRFVDYSEETQALWEKFVDIVDLVAYRKKKPTRWMREGRVVALDDATLCVEWANGQEEAFDLTRFPLPPDADFIKPNDWAEFVIERDFFTTEPRAIVSVKKFERRELSLDELNELLSSVKSD